MQQNEKNNAGYVVSEVVTGAVIGGGIGFIGGMIFTGDVKTSLVIGGTIAAIAAASNYRDAQRTINRHDESIADRVAFNEAVKQYLAAGGEIEIVMAK